MTDEAKKLGHEVYVVKVEGAFIQYDNGYRIYNAEDKKGFEINNIDVTVLLQKPKLRKHIIKMIETLSAVMKIDKKKLSIKATTTEGLGFVGREEGVAAHCVTLINKIWT